MSIFNFVTQDELDDLDEDPRMAFLGLFNYAQRSLSKQLDRPDPNDEREWNTRQDIEQSFMNVIVAAGKRYEIEPAAASRSKIWPISIYNDTRPRLYFHVSGNYATTSPRLPQRMSPWPKRWTQFCSPAIAVWQPPPAVAPASCWCKHPNRPVITALP